VAHGAVVELDLGQWGGMSGAVDEVDDSSSLAVDTWKSIRGWEAVARDLVLGARPAAL